MDIQLKANLKIAMQQFLDDNADDIGSLSGIWQDDTQTGANATLMANAAEVVIDAQQLQQELNERFSG